MGWLELLALLKRVLPLLDRLAPVLESAVAGRFSGRAEAERLASAALAETGPGDLRGSRRGHPLTCRPPAHDGGATCRDAASP